MRKTEDILNIFAKKIGLWVHVSEYPQYMFWNKIRKDIEIPLQTPSFFFTKKEGLWGYTFHGHVFLMFRIVISILISSGFHSNKLVDLKC